jgi:hypothetical protein
VQERVVLERDVELALAVEDGHGDPALVEEHGELVRAVDRVGIEVGVDELANDLEGFIGRQGDGDGRTGHGLSLAA